MFNRPFNLTIAYNLGANHIQPRLFLTRRVSLKDRLFGNNIQSETFADGQNSKKFGGHQKTLDIHD